MKQPLAAGQRCAQPVLVNAVTIPLEGGINAAGGIENYTPRPAGVVAGRAILEMTVLPVSQTVCGEPQDTAIAK